MATNKNITMKQFNGTDYDTLYPKTIASQVDGLFQILVTTYPNTEVTASLNGKTVSAMSDSSGLAILKIPSCGTWTVTVGSVSKTINIDAAAVFYLVMSNLESLSWSQVATISKMGLASTTFHIGDEKTLTVNGVSYTAVIIGFDHDIPADSVTYGRDKAGITWQLKNCLNSKYPMNSSDINNGGWKQCEMRTSTMETLLSQMASDLKNAIVKVKKFTSKGDNSSDVVTTEDSLFLLSEVEIFGPTIDYYDNSFSSKTAFSFSGEGSWYEYYQSGNSRVKTVSGSASDWWERSPRKGFNNAFCSVQPGGSQYRDEASNSNGVAFAFCV